MPTVFVTPIPGLNWTSALVAATWNAINALEVGSTYYIETAGSSNAYTATVAPAFATLGSGQAGAILHIKASFTNTNATPTLNVSGLGAKTLVAPNGGALRAGSIQSGQHYLLRFDGTNWVVLNPFCSRHVQTSVQASGVGNVGAGLDDTLSYSLPAYSLGVDGQYLEATFHVSFAANANNKTFKVIWGATTLYDSTAVAQNGGGLRVKVTIIRTGAATQDVAVEVFATDAASIPSSYTWMTATEDLTAAVILKGQAESGSGSSNDVVNQALIVNHG